MPDLGKYTYTVLSSWAATILLLLVILALTLWQSRRARLALEHQEARMAALGGAKPARAANEAQPAEASHG